MTLHCPYCQYRTLELVWDVTGKHYKCTYCNREVRGNFAKVVDPLFEKRSATDKRRNSVAIKLQ